MAYTPNGNLKYELNGKALTREEARRYIDTFPRTPFIPFEEQTFEHIEGNARIMMLVYGVTTFTSRLNGLTFIAE